MTGIARFELGAVAVPIFANMNHQQQVEEIGGRAVLDMANGSAVVQQRWTRLQFTLSGDGPLPAGLAGLDLSGPLLFKAGLDRSITSSSNVIVIPAARRSDTGYTPQGFAIVDDRPVVTTISIATNTATLGTVSGASAYQVRYFPQMNVVVPLGGIGESVDDMAGTYSWSLVLRGSD